MAHDANMAAGAHDNHLEVFGEANRFSLTPAKTGVKVNLTAIIGEETSERRRRQGKIEILTVRTIGFSKDPASTYGGVAVVQTNDKATLDGVDYMILRRKPGSGNLQKIVIQIAATAEDGRPDRRGQR